MEAITEKQALRINGFIAAFFWLVLVVVEILLLRGGIKNEVPSFLWFFIPLLLVIALATNGFFIVQPNDSRVLVLFGKYLGTVRDSGFWWANPFTTRTKVTLRIRNFNSEKIKVNDLHGNRLRLPQ